MVQSGLTAKGLLFDQCVDVTQAASLLIVVETITNDEVVGDTQCCILHVKRHGELARLEQQCADTDTVGLILLQFLHHVLHGAVNPMVGVQPENLKLKELLQRLQREDIKEVIIATKTAAKNADEFWKDIRTSLDNLQTDYIDIYQFHNPSFCPKPGDGTGLYEAMLEAKQNGMIKHIGITNHRLKVAHEAIDSGLYETLQFPFCYLASDEDI